MAADVASLSKSLQTKLFSYIPNNEQARKSLLQSARSLVQALETPTERFTRLAYAEPALYAATRVLVDLKVFNTLAASSKSQGATQLAHASGSDPKLLERLLKLVAVEDFVHETGPDEYTASDITKLLSEDGPRGAAVDLYAPFRVYGAFPEFLKETNYRNPSDNDKTAWKKALNTDKHYFEWLFSPGNEYEGRAFEDHMKWNSFGPRWFESETLINEIFGAGVKDDEVLLVDVGGSTGADLAAFRKACTGLSGRLIVQDLPATIETLDKSELQLKGVEAMSHNFFTPEPVEGAKAYCMLRCLHDWPDEQCTEILSNLKPALRSGYSKVLVNEIVVPDVGANWWETTIDMLMMTVHSSYERREKDWRALVESAGLTLTKVWSIEGAVEKLLEIDLDP